MALTIGTLTALLRADDSGMRRGLDDGELRMRGFQRDVEGRIRHLDGRFATLGEQMAAGLRTADGEGRRFNFSLGRLVSMAAGLGGVALSIGKIGLMLGAAVPLAAGLVATLGQIAPAAGLAVTALFAIQLATNAIKLGMQGVGDAVKLALDPSKAEEFNEALKKLAPNAKAFAKEVKSLQPEFKELQQTVQNRLFKGLASVLRDMGQTVLPVLRTGLMDAADSLNSMAVGVGRSASSLARNGTLGKAIAGANAGLRNLSRAPGQFLTALTQVGAAAAPAFGRLTAAAGKAIDRFSQQFTQSFKSGAMEKAIEAAIDTIAQLGRVIGNVLGGIGNIFKAVSVDGQGLFSTLEKITQAFEDFTASKEFQEALGELSKTVGTLVDAVLPLLQDALKAIMPVIKILAPPIRDLIKTLGEKLKPVIQKLAPVLEAFAEAFAELIPIVEPFIALALDLAAQVLPMLTPLFEALRDIFKELQPVAEQLAKNLGEQLKPILEKLPEILERLLPKFVEMAERLFPLLLDILIQLGPELGKLSVAFGELLIELTPLLEKFLEFQIFLLDKLIPYIGPLATLIGSVLVGALRLLTRFITEWVIPIVRTVVALFNGDWAGAMRLAGGLVVKLKETAGRAFESLKARASLVVAQLASDVIRRAREMASKFVGQIQRLVSDAVARIATLPTRILGALGGMGSLLWHAGSNLIGGFIDGIKARIPSVQGVLGGLTSMLPSWKGPASLDKRILAPAGAMLIQGFQRGISSQIPALRGQLQSLTGALPGMAVGAAGGRGGAAGSAGVQRVEIVLSGPEEMKRLIRAIVKVDGRGSVQTAFGR